MKKAISILGPTHTKKTELALSIFKEYPSNIISVDSVQIYKEANIGSNKPDQAILKKNCWEVFQGNFLLEHFQIKKARGILGDN